MTEKKDDEAREALLAYFRKTGNIKVPGDDELWLAAWAESRKRAGEDIKEAVDALETMTRVAFLDGSQFVPNARTMAPVKVLKKHHRVAQDGAGYRWK